MALSTEPNEIPTQHTTATFSTARKKNSWFGREARKSHQNVRQNATTATRPLIGSYFPDKPPKRGTPIGLSQDELFKIACNYEEFSFPSLSPNITIREGLQNMDDVTQYGVTQEQQKELWKEEISRLSSAVTDLKAPVSFIGTEKLSHDTKDGYEILANLADQMWNALNIIVHDSESVYATHCPDLVNEEQQDQSRMVLQRLMGDDDEEEDSQGTPQATKGLKGTREDYFELVNYITATLARIFSKAAYGKAWHENNLACLAKLSAKMKVLSTQPEELASISLSMAPSRQKVRPAAANHNYSRKPGNLNMNREGTFESLDAMLESLNSSESAGKTSSGPETQRKSVKRYYWLHTVKYRFPIQAVLRRLILHLRGQYKLTTTSKTSYEICAMLYNTGFEEFPNLIFQDINGEYIGSSRQENVNVSQAVFEVLNLTMKELEAIQQKKRSRGDHRQSNIPSNSESFQVVAQHQSTPGIVPPTVASTVGDSEETSAKRFNEGLSAGIRSTSREQNDGSNETKVPDLVGTTISWNYTVVDSSSEPSLEPPGMLNEPACSDPEPKRLPLKSMSEVIMAMVPLLLASPITVDMITDFIGLCASTTFADANPEVMDSQVFLYQHTNFKASFCLTTDEYRSIWRNRPHRPVSQLSKALIARDNLLSWKAAEAILVDSQTLPLTNSSEEENERKRKEEKDCIEKGRKELQDARKKMSGWIFEEKGVRVKCGWYVWTVATVAITLVLGGISIGITVRDRLEGVDPFGITTFCWVLAAFVILMAKSIRVENWPWRDFLHRQVLCRTVSELHSVTGINDQLILAKLLYDEPKTILQTRGPYNCVFTRKADSGDGFSIDRPLSMRTMLLSGLIMIQVQAAYHGEFLVCLDIRTGKDYNIVLQSNDLTDDREYIVSNRISAQDSQDTSTSLATTGKYIRATKSNFWNSFLISRSTNKPISAFDTEIHQKIPLQRTKKVTWNRVIGVYSQKDWFFI
ncbi:hypothetical protein ACMFMG_008735 [Clarireedia jacksonii]